VSISGILFLSHFISCKEDKKSNEPFQYASLSDTTAYVGINTCKQCHSDKHETFMHTGMGLSFDQASPKKSSAVFKAHDKIYDRYKNLNYHPYWKGDSLMLLEYRLEKGDIT